MSDAPAYQAPLMTREDGDAWRRAVNIASMVVVDIAGERIRGHRTVRVWSVGGRRRVEIGWTSGAWYPDPCRAAVYELRMAPTLGGAEYVARGAVAVWNRSVYGMADAAHVTHGIRFHEAEREDDGPLTAARE